MISTRTGLGIGLSQDGQGRPAEWPAATMSITMLHRADCELLHAAQTASRNSSGTVGATRRSDSLLRISRATLSPAMMVFPVLTQVLTSANWGGAVGNFFTGGLNLQVEHHLFPAVSFMHCAFLRQQECQILPWACVCTRMLPEVACHASLPTAAS